MGEISLSLPPSLLLSLRYVKVFINQNLYGTFTGFRFKFYSQKRKADFCSDKNLNIIFSVHGKFHFSLVLLINQETSPLICSSTLNDSQPSWAVSDLFKDALPAHVGFHICNGSATKALYWSTVSGTKIHEHTDGPLSVCMQDPPRLKSLCISQTHLGKSLQIKRLM